MRSPLRRRPPRRSLLVLLLLALLPGIADARAGAGFSDGFEGGGLSKWTTVKGAVVQGGVVHGGAWAARLEAAGAPAYLRRTLGNTPAEIYARTFFSVQARSTQATLLALLAPDRRPILRVGLALGGRLFRIAGASGTKKLSLTGVSGSAWHELQLHARVNGKVSTTEVWLDGVRLDDLSGKLALGSDPVGHVQVGEHATGREFDVAIDDVATGRAFLAAPDVSAPSDPSDLAATAVTPQRVDLSWTASSDDRGVTGYTIYRDGLSLGTAGSTTYSDGSVVPGTTYAYAVDAVDAAGNRSSPSASLPVEVPPDEGERVLMAAGDIACDPADPGFNGGAGTSSKCRQGATAALIGSQDPDAVLALGDNQYECSGMDAFAQSYDASWGTWKSRTYAVVGNHEYQTTGGTGCPSVPAAGHFEYFGSNAGPADKGYYSFDLGAWHLIALNSECGQVGGCGDSSPQKEWLEADLAAHPAECTLAFYHRPRFGPTEMLDTPLLAALWTELEEAHVDIVLNGHVHAYDRFMPLGGSGQPDADGIRQFIVGTGGKGLQPFGSPGSTVETQTTSDFGVLRLSLRPGSYDWSFMSVTPGGFTDDGTADCV
jgi:acid phosphatase type 7